MALCNKPASAKEWLGSITERGGAMPTALQDAVSWPKSDEKPGGSDKDDETARTLNLEQPHIELGLVLWLVATTVSGWREYCVENWQSRMAVAGDIDGWLVSMVLFALLA